jgi:hypothetical protein
MVANVGDTALNVREGLDNVVSEFSSSTIADVGSSFLDSNSIIAKFVFLIAILIIFFILMNLGIYIISIFATTDTSPYIFKGKYSLAKKRHIRQDPKLTGGKPIFRSNDEDKGIEFTWSTWLRLDLPDVDGGGEEDIDYHIFSKGTQPDDSGTYQINGPGVYADASNNELKINIKMDTNSGDPNNPEIITIYDLPIDRWFHLAIRLQNKIMDIYVNGTITTRVPFSNVPKQNYGDIFVGYNSLSGDISNLRYFDRALNVFQLTNIVMSGPDLRNPDRNEDIGNANYLSNSWYTNSKY